VSGIAYEKFAIVLACGIISLAAAVMNYRDTESVSGTGPWMFASAALIFICAALLYHREAGRAAP